MGNFRFQKAGAHDGVLSEPGPDGVDGLIAFFQTVVFFPVKQIVLAVFLIRNPAGGHPEKPQRPAVPERIQKAAGSIINFLRHIRRAVQLHLTVPVHKIIVPERNAHTADLRLIRADSHAH